MHRASLKLYFHCFCLTFLPFDNNNKVAAQSQCCTEHYELGKCIPGVDDKNPSGNCWKYCMDNCDEQKGGFCKKNGNKHHCHCYC
ncbi:defensin protein [Salix suchowensis]|nr:defensin protein [Salix suchowensis]